VTLWLLLTLAACGDKDTTGDGDVTQDEDGDGFSGGADGDDCDDADAGVNPDGVEACDTVDNDCDGSVDEGVSETWYADSDGDGFGDLGASEQACAPIDGYESNSGDCDDTDPEIRPSAEEVCDEADNDCDGGVDEDFADSLEVWFRDADGDGYGDESDFEPACRAPEGYTAEPGDCDDGDDTINPGAVDIPEDGVDQDCDGEDALSITDADGDGYMSDVDCDDDPVTGPEINPGAVEVCDGLDNDCDGAVDPPWFESDFSDAVDPAALSINGDAEQLWDGPNGYLSLTTGAESQAGTAFFTALQPGDVWGAGFTVDISGGVSPYADGMAFAFLNETDPTIVGADGGSLALRYFEGYAFEWDTYSNRDAGDPVDAEHIALIDTSDMNHLWYEVEDVHGQGPQAVEIAFSMGDWTLWIDGAEVASGTVDGYDLEEVMFGFGAGTGLYTANHTVDDVWIGCPTE